MTEEEFKKRMWDKIVKPAWEDAYKVPDPDKLGPWVPLAVILSVLGLIVGLWAGYLLGAG